MKAKTSCLFLAICNSLTGILFLPAALLNKANPLWYRGVILVVAILMILQGILRWVDFRSLEDPEVKKYHAKKVIIEVEDDSEIEIKQ